ncbi:hypothetical protein DFH06DRAFT_380921 [Mycena polygramma]|nr:hypothetical protein DFH06DRAFT_380921 [Mycena polygramma]
MSCDTAVQLPNNDGVDGDSNSGREVSQDARENALYQAQMAALLNFRPSSRDVISGIAPHVFEDQPQRSRYRPRPRRRTSTSSLACRRRSVSPAPNRSPLRLPTAISLEGNNDNAFDHSGPVKAVYTTSKGEENIILQVYDAAPLDDPPPDSTVEPVPSPSATQDKSPNRRNGFRIDRILKCVLHFI